MSTRRKFTTKCLALIAIIAMSTLIWGYSADIDPVDAVAVTSMNQVHRPVLWEDVSGIP